MTDHNTMQMHHEPRRITDKAMVKAILDRCHVATVVFHDKPYPYAVPMNYGYCWEGEKPTFYFHMATTGHRLALLRENPKIMLNVFDWLDRAGYKPYRNETHDYRSVNVFGTGEVVTPGDEEEFLKGLGLLQAHNFRQPPRRLTTEMKEKLLVLRVTGEIVTAKSQYPISTLEEVPMPENLPREGKEV